MKKNKYVKVKDIDEIFLIWFEELFGAIASCKDTHVSRSLFSIVYALDLLHQNILDREVFINEETKN